MHPACLCATDRPRFDTIALSHMKKTLLDACVAAFHHISGEPDHRHSANNPKSQFKGTASSLDDVLGAPMVYAPLTKKQCCPTSEGAAAAVLCSHDFVVANGLQDQAVKIAGMALTTDTPSTFNEKSCIKMVGSDMTKAAAAKAFAQAGIGPKDVQVVELHDCFSANELITYEGLGLAEEGKGHLLVRNGDNTYGGKYVVNPSGGLESKGHPLGATGLAQAYELSLQVRGQAGPRQVPNVKYALQHNLGLGGAAVVGVLTKGFASGSSKL